MFFTRKITNKIKFDVILNMEIVEHVEDINIFLKACSNLLKKMGLCLLQHSIKLLNHIFLQ